MVRTYKVLMAHRITKENSKPQTVAHQECPGTGNHITSKHQEVVYMNV